MYSNNDCVQFIKKMTFNEIYRDSGALKKLGMHIETLNLTEEQENLFALGFSMGIEYARIEPKIKWFNDVEENSIQSVYCC